MPHEDPPCDDPRHHDPAWLRYRSALITWLQVAVGPVVRQWHWPGNDDLPLDLLELETSEEHPWPTVVTCGMGALPMHPPRAAEDQDRAELALVLPADWPPQEFPWLLGALADLARYPHERQTWLWEGHSMGYHPPEPFGPGTKLSAWLLFPWPPVGKAPAWPPGGPRLLHAVPAHEREIDLKLEHGFDYVARRLRRRRYWPALAPSRPPLRPRRE